MCRLFPVFQSTLAFVFGDSDEARRLPALHIVLPLFDAKFQQNKDLFSSSPTG